MTPRPKPTPRGLVTIYPAGGSWKWTVTGPDGEALADSAGWRAERVDAEDAAAATLEALLNADLPATRLRVATWLAGLDDSLRSAIVRNAEEIVRSRRQGPAEAAPPPP